MTTITLTAASSKYGIPAKRIIGFALRNEFGDPLVIDRANDGEYLLLDDWRLQNLAPVESKLH